MKHTYNFKPCTVANILSHKSVVNPAKKTDIFIASIIQIF